MQNQVRIIGGEWRSRIIYFPKMAELRPTPGRMRETLFNWLGQTLEGKTCLDLFAGSGALGFEALSRGAKQVVMVESNRAIYTALNDNAQRLATNNLAIHLEDARQFLMRSAAKYDVIFLDPPFNTTDIPTLIAQAKLCLGEDGKIYLESALRFEQFVGFDLVRHKKAGRVNSYLLGLSHA